MNGASDFQEEKAREDDESDFTRKDNTSEGKSISMKVILCSEENIDELQYWNEGNYDVDRMRESSFSNE